MQANSALLSDTLGLQLRRAPRGKTRTLALMKWGAATMFGVLAATSVVRSACGQIPPNRPPMPELCELIEGTWGSKEPGIYSCDQNPHTIKITEGNTRAVFTVRKPVPMADGRVTDHYAYRILYAENNRITMMVEDEIRRTPQGDRVIWVLILRDKDTYFWRRTDWPAQNGTSDVV